MKSLVSQSYIHLYHSAITDGDDPKCFFTAMVKNITENHIAKAPTVQRRFNKS